MKTTMAVRVLSKDGAEYFCCVGGSEADRNDVVSAELKNGNECEVVEVTLNRSGFIKSYARR